jgi:D-alanine-D-alanine ligase
LAQAAAVKEARTDMKLVPGTLTIGVLMGGCSRERAVSLLSGRAVAEALQALGHDVRPCDVRPGDLGPDLVRGVDVAFLALHGEWGEDGGIQEELDRLGACYTGSGPEASRLAMNKVAAKERFAEAGVPTPAFRLAGPGDAASLREAFDAIGPGLVVKPIADGSSIDVALCDSLSSARGAAEAVWARGERALLERRIAGRELTVGIVGRDTLPVIEIRVPRGWYNYEAKYESDATEYVFDHGLPREAEAQVVAVALAAHDALGCRDLSRVDLILPPQGEPQVLEVNTIPGFTSHSLVPKAAARAGLTFGRLCERIVALARQRCRKSPRGAGEPNR